MWKWHEVLLTPEELLGRDSKMSKKKNKWKSLPSACRTSIIGMIILTVVGIGLIIYGIVFGTGSDDLNTVEGEIVSIEKVERDLSASQQEKLSDEDSLYEFEVAYRYTIDGSEYDYYTERVHYDKGKLLKNGDKKVLKYTVKNGKTVINPETKTSYGVLGIVFIVAGLLAGAAAFVLRPKHK